MKTHNFVHEITNTSAVFGRNSKATVIFEGKQPQTDGNEVILPVLPEGYDISDDAVKIFRGYVDHEAGGHVRHTDFNEVKKLGEYCKETNRPALFNLANVTEDVFIERKVIEDYPGSEKNLRFMSEVTSKDILKTLNPEQYEGVTETTVSLGILIKGMQGRAGPAGKEIFNKLPKKVQEFSEVWAEEALKVTKTSEAIDLAKAIYKFLKEDPNLNEEPEDFDLQDCDLEGTPDGQGDKELKPKEFSIEDKKKELLKRLAKGKSLEYSDDEGNNEVKIEGVRKPTEGPLFEYRIHTTRHDKVFTRDSKELRRGKAQDFLVEKGKMKGTIAVMKNKLKRALLSKDRRDWDLAKEYGRLDTKRLVSGSNGSPNVYKTRADREEMDTAVEILVDLSGSMKGKKICMARKVVIALASSLEGTGVSYSVTGFTTDLYPIPYGTFGKSDRYARVEGLSLYKFKEFSDSLRVSMGAIAMIPHLPLRNNTDREAVLWSGRNLKKRPEKRKVLLVLSDGDPEQRVYGVYDNTLSEGLRDAIKEVSKDVECIGIGILTDAVKKFYPKYVVVNDLNDLTGAALKELSKTLIGKGLSL